MDHITCDCGKTYRRSNKARHLKSSYHIKRTAATKEPIKKECNCECGSEVLNKNIAKHRKSKKHIKFVEQIEKKTEKQIKKQIEIDNKYLQEYLELAKDNKEITLRIKDTIKKNLEGQYVQNDLNEINYEVKMYQYKLTMGPHHF